MTGYLLPPLVSPGASLLGGLLGIVVSVRPVTPRMLGWGAIAGYSGGAVAGIALGAEDLTSGTTGGAAISAIGGLIAGIVAGLVLQDVSLNRARATTDRRPGRWSWLSWRGRGESKTGPVQQPSARPAAERPRHPPRAYWRGWPKREAGSGSPDSTTMGWPVRVGVAVAIGVVAVLAAALGLGLPAVAVLLLLAAVSLTRRGWPLSTALFTVALTVSAAWIVLGNLVLSHLAVVGQPVGTVAVAALATCPLLIHLADRRTWVGAMRAGSLFDLAALLVAGLAAHSWLATFRGLSDNESVAHLQRLGEDNAAHMMMLHATTVSGTALGRSASSAAIANGFTGYFPGGSLWQAAIGALLPNLTDVRLYVVSTGVLFALLAGAASSIAALTRCRWASIGALAVVVLGALGIRASLAMYEIGFPGQLLVACLLVAALALLLAENRVRRGSWIVVVVLLFYALAAWWTWNLVAPLFCVPVAVVVYQQLRARGPLSARALNLTVVAASVVFALGVLVEHARVSNALDELSIDGLVFRSVPIWFALGLCLGLPLAYRGLRRPEPAAARALVFGVAGGMLALMLWQLSQTGVIAYYSWKLEYLAFAVGWPAAAFGIARTIGKVEGRWLPLWQGIGAVAVACSLPLLLPWPAQSYHDWQVTRGVAGASSATTCAIEQAHKQRGDIVIATGFGEQLTNYLTTKAMSVGVGNNDSRPFWLGILYDGPAAWPWSNAARPIVLVQGPDATSASTQAVVDAAATQGVDITVAARSCGTPR